MMANESAKATNGAWFERLRVRECRDATYPAQPALVLARACGARLFDVEGTAYIDLCSGFGALPLGHNPPEHAAAWRARLGEELAPITHGLGDVYASTAKVELLEALLAVLPGHFSQASLAITGSQAIETALKTAMLATGRTGILSFVRGYHGVDLGVLPVTSRPDFKAPFAGWLKSELVETVAFGADPRLVELAAAKLASSAAGLAAILVEPIQGRGGVNIPPAGWLAALRTIADRHGALLIFDEVFTGMGRTGRLSHADEVACDLLCLGKALGGGFPISAVVGTAAAMQAWPQSQGEALHTGTFFGHPLSCEMALLTLRAIVDQKLAARAKVLGDAARARLAAELGGHRRVVDIRGRGLMLALACAEDGDGARLMDALRADGVIALASGDRGECIQLTPPLNIESALFDTALTRLVAAVKAL